jgi:hypothetical protein
MSLAKKGVSLARVVAAWRSSYTYEEKYRGRPSSA